MAKEGQCKVAWLKDNEVLEEDCVQAPHELKEPVRSEVILVKATLRPRAPACACLKARLLLLDSGPKLFLQVV